MIHTDIYFRFKSSIEQYTHTFPHFAGGYTHTFPHFTGGYTHTFPHFAGKYEYTSPQSKYLLYLTGKQIQVPN